MKQTKGMPITGGRLPRKTRPVLTNQALTSSTAQRQVRQPDVPQQDPQLRVSAPTHSGYRAGNGAEFARSTVQRFKTNAVREMQDPNFADVGYQRGATKPKAGNPIISGRPTVGNKRVAGDGNQALAKGIKSRSGKMRTNLDIFSPRVLHEVGLTRL